MVSMEECYNFSFFRAPVQNTVSSVAFSILDAYRYISEPIAKERTELLRAIASQDEARRFKAQHFDYCTFSGLFKSRSSSQLIRHSGLICLDFDHVDDIPALKRQLLEHEFFETILMFTSPSGNGVKWIVEVNLQGWEHSHFFKSMANCLKATGIPPVDSSGSDVARACFLPYDPDVYINPKYQDYAKEDFYTPAVGRMLR